MLRFADSPFLMGQTHNLTLFNKTTVAFYAVP